MLLMNEALMLGSLQQHELAEAYENLNITLQWEIQQRKKVEATLRASDQRFRILFDLQPVGVYSCDAAGLLQNFNRCAAEIWGREPALEDFNEKFCGAYKLFRPDGEYLPRELCFMAEVLSEKIPNALDVEFIVERPDGSRLNCIANIKPLRNEHGEITGAINSFYDITHRKVAEERQLLLSNEIAHRSKNLLAVVMSIISRTLTGSGSLAEARDTLSERIQALARWQPIYSITGFDGVPLGPTILDELEAFSNQVIVAGPEVTIAPKAAQTFSLLVHELATNASKYGALSQPAGQVNVSWSIEGHGKDALFKFKWLESKGPIVAVPTGKGFGRAVLERAVEAEFGGKPRISFDPEGVCYEIDLPLSSISAENAY